MSMTTPTPHEVDALVERIKLLLRGQGPDLQGAALADLVAIFFLADHFLAHCRVMPAMRGLIPINEALQFGRVGKPEGWETQ